MANILVYPDINGNSFKRNNRHALHHRRVDSDYDYKSGNGKGSYSVVEKHEQIEQLRYNFEIHYNEKNITFSIDDLILDENVYMFYNPSTGEVYNQQNTDEDLRSNNSYKMLLKKDSYNKLSAEEVYGCAAFLFHKSTIVAYKEEGSTEVTFVKFFADEQDFKIVLKSIDSLGFKDSYSYEMAQTELSKAIF